MPQSNNKIPVKITDQFQDIDPWHLEIQIWLATQTNSNNLAAKVTWTLAGELTNTFEEANRHYITSTCIDLVHSFHTIKENSFHLR